MINKVDHGRSNQIMTKAAEAGLIMALYSLCHSFALAVPHGVLGRFMTHFPPRSVS